MPLITPGHRTGQVLNSTQGWGYRDSAAVENSTKDIAHGLFFLQITEYRFLTEKETMKTEE